MERGKEVDSKNVYTPVNLSPVQAGGSTGGQLHIHHHYAPEPVKDTAPVWQGERPTTLDKYLPAIVVWVLMIMTLGILAVAGLILTPMIVAITTGLAQVAISLAVSVGMVALLALAVSAGLRNYRLQEKDRLKSEALKAKAKGRK